MGETWLLREIGVVIPRRLVPTECNSVALVPGMVDGAVFLVARDGCGEAGDGYAMGIVSFRRLFDGIRVQKLTCNLWLL